MDIKLAFELFNYLKYYLGKISISTQAILPPLGGDSDIQDSRPDFESATEIL